MTYQVVHSTLGRCRLRVPYLAEDADFAEILHRTVVALEFVTTARINLEARSIVVHYRSHYQSQKLAIERAESYLGNCVQVALQQYETLALTAGSQVVSAASSEPEAEEPDLTPLVNHWSDLGMPAVGLSLALLALPLELPPLLVGAAVLGATLPWYQRATNSVVQHGHTNIDLLDSAWMTFQTLRGQFVAPALKAVLVETRRSLRGMGGETREQEALAVLQQLDQPVWVERNGEWQSIAASTLQVGDRIRVKAGEPILVDGLIVAGHGVVDYRLLMHPASDPEAREETNYTIACGEGYPVYAIATLQSGILEILVQRTGEHTRMGIAARLAHSMPVHDTRLGAQQAEFVKAAILPTLVLGGAIFVATGNIGAALSPYQFDFGSGIPISISTTLLSALTYAARHGVYIRSAQALELLAQVDTVVIDELTREQSVQLEYREAIARLQQQGIAVYCISSESIEQGAELAAQLNIPEHHVLTEVTLPQKAALIRGLRNQGHTVALLSNDSRPTPQLHPDLTVVSATTNAAIAQTDAAIVLLDADWRGLNFAIAIAQRAMTVLYQNTALITVPNLVMQIGGGMILGVSPVYNVIINNGSAILAEFLNGNHPHFDTIRPNATVLTPVLRQAKDPTRSCV